MRRRYFPTHANCPVIGTPILKAAHHLAILDELAIQVMANSDWRLGLRQEQQHVCAVFRRCLNWLPFVCHRRVRSTGSRQHIGPLAVNKASGPSETGIASLRQTLVNDWQRVSPVSIGPRSIPTLAG